MFNHVLKVRLSIVVLVVLIVLTILFTYLYYNTDDEKNAALLGGLVAGLLVAIIQFVMDWNSYQSSEKLNKLQLVEVLYTRDNKEYYGEFIKNTQTTIDIMGVTGDRFMRDFVNDDSAATNQSRIIIDLLQKEVIVRILMPKIKYLEDDSINKANDAHSLYSKITAKYPNNFIVKYFDHVPAHSIFKVDNECIIGPVFMKLQSRFTPAIHFYNSSPIVKRYLDYFEEEWGKADARIN